MSEVTTLAPGRPLGQRLAARYDVAFDVLPPLLLLIASVLQTLHQGDRVPLYLMLSAALALPPLVRRRWPLMVFAIVSVVAFVQWSTDARLNADIALLVAFYTVASRRSLKVTLGAALVMEVGVGLAVGRWSGDASAPFIFILLSGMVTAAGVLGAYTRTRAAYLVQLQQRAERLERERDQQAQLAVAAERARIAREMHDIVAHHLTVMIALSEGAAVSVGQSPDAASAAMRTVSATGREALADTRRLLGVLRDDPDAAVRVPLPDLSRLDSLLEQVRAAGLPATLQTIGTAEALPPALQLTVYRVVQEALTNTLKHAGPGTEASVTLEYVDGELTVDVRDDGRESILTSAGVTTGHGVIGMHERVGAWGGRLQCGPTQPHGWRVHAMIPLPTQPVASASRATELETSAP